MICGFCFGLETDALNSYVDSHKCGRCLTRGDMGQREQGEEMSLTKFYTRKTGVESMKTDANCRAMLSR